MNHYHLSRHRNSSASSSRPTLLAGIVGTMLVVLSGNSYAQAQSNDENRTRYGIGAAVLIAKEGYRDVGSETRVLPGLSIQNKWVSLYGPQLDLKLLGNDKRSWWIGPRIEYRFDGYEQEDGTVFRGMAKRKGGVFYGVAGQVDLGSDFELEADYVRASSRDGGFERGAVASLQLSRTYRNGPWSWAPRIGMEYLSSSYVDYYYGVRATEATPTRPAYAGKSSWSPEFGLLVTWQANPRHLLFANFNYERYGSEVRNSPLMNAKGIPQVVFGYEYRLK
ncbi:MAG: MipA/OmpV family protein [Burkholderiales bacterium]